MSNATPTIVDPYSLKSPVEVIVHPSRCSGGVGVALLFKQ